MARVVEYFGLPGVGKSTELGPKGYCGSVSGHPAPVPDGPSINKGLNTLLGMVVKRRLLFLLAQVLAGSNMRELWLSLRPFLVVFERIGRITRLQRITEAEEIHIDEGPMQSVWRMFLEKEPNVRNLALLNRCLAELEKMGSYICYVSCPKHVHISRILSRGKPGFFDQAVASGNYALYRQGRLWMAAMLRSLRRSGRKLTWVCSTREH